ncbi:hypothetical protein EDC63_1454 [Sulfurirhabdus autotrophica]|uniref:Uncharacterized protein n=1 Tax=Sulfurirhabdus autotrophica TaxID=1706046 RepID=A0A4R3XTY1_9PROT|nr:hypothetical protein EDC63_1454 [Sulfurirhabdus autotrophica]
MSIKFWEKSIFRWTLLVLSVLVAIVCFYFTFAYGSLSVAPSLYRERYELLANNNLYIGITSLLFGVCAFFFLKRKSKKR